MPYKPKQYCKNPGCNQLVESGYCEKHKQPISEYDSKRNAVNAKTYDTTWRRLRRLKLSRNPLCEICLFKEIIEVATEVDHIIPVSQQPELRLVYENLQSACTPCHSKKTREENKK